MDETEIKETERFKEAVMVEWFVRNRERYMQWLLFYGYKIRNVQTGAMLESDYMAHWERQLPVLEHMSKTRLIGEGFSFSEISRAYLETTLGTVKPKVLFYCSSCDDFRPVQIEEIGTDKLNPDLDPWGDIVCEECHLVIGTVTASEPGHYAVVRLHAPVDTVEPVPQGAEKDKSALI